MIETVVGGEVTDTTEARATVVVVPRDRFSAAQKSLESILADTTTPFELVYVDAGSPRGLRSWLTEQSEVHGFELISRDEFLSPNAARNLGLSAVKTEFSVFVDNDVSVKSGWLEKLIACADETGAAAVGPLTCEYDFETVHFAGGEVEILEEAEDEEIVRRVRDKMYMPQRKVENVKEELVRKQVELCEFHTVMVRTEVMREIGGLDEEMLSTREHLDFSLSLAQAGGTVWFEPESVVLYMPPPPLKLSDMHYYMLRWSNDWERRSLSHFRAKWDLTEDEFFKNRLARLGWRRQSIVVGAAVRRITLGRGSARLDRALKRLEHRLNERVTARHARRESRSAKPRAA